MDREVQDGVLAQEQADLLIAQHALRSYLVGPTDTTYSQAVDQALADGAITQAQADLLKAAGSRFVPIDPGGELPRPIR